MELLELLLLFAGIFLVPAFEIFYLCWLKEVKRISPVRIGRIAALWVTGFMALSPSQSSLPGFVLVALFFLTFLIVWAINSHTAGSAFHGFFMTLWQLVCAAIVLYLLYLICSFGDRPKKAMHERDGRNK